MSAGVRRLRRLLSLEQKVAAAVPAADEQPQFRAPGPPSVHSPATSEPDQLTRF